jgi:hypothetical protein
MVFECEEDVAGAVVFFEVGSEVANLVLSVVEVFLDCLVGFTGSGYETGFCAGVGVVGQDAIFNQEDAEITEFGMYPTADEGWEVLLEPVD